MVEEENFILEMSFVVLLFEFFFFDLIDISEFDEDEFFVLEDEYELDSFVVVFEFDILLVCLEIDEIFIDNSFIGEEVFILEIYLIEEDEEVEIMDQEEEFVVLFLFCVSNDII